MEVRLGMIGLGGIAEKAYLPALAGLEGAELAVICSRRAEQVARVAARYHVPLGITSTEELVRARPDAAIVLTPSPTHYRVVKELLEAGLDVLVEKPATESTVETAELGALADRLGRVLMIAFNRRFAPLHRRALELFQGRAVSLIVAEKHRERAVNPSLRAHYYEEDIHLIDLLRFYGGEAHAISTESRVRKDKLVDAASLIRFERGGIGVFTASLEAGGWMERITLHGEGLSVQVDSFRELRILHGETDEVHGREIAARWSSSLEVRGFVPLLEHFIECVRTRQTPQTSALDSFRTQFLLEEMVAKGI